jgi:hypothetical protein
VRLGVTIASLAISALVSPQRKRADPALYKVADRIGVWWCNLVHEAPMWPINGRYECGKCGRHHPVPWI